MKPDTLSKKITDLENYINSDVELTEEDKAAYDYYLSKLKTASVEERLKFDKKLVEVSTSKIKRDRINNIMPILNRIKRVIETLDVKELKKISILRQELFNSNNINDYENKCLIDIIKEVYDVMYVQDKFIVSEIENLIQMEHTKDNLKLISDKIDMLVNQELINQYKVKLLLIKAENAVKEKNKDSAFDFLHSALEKLDEIEDISVKNTLHVMLAKIRRDINSITEDEPVNNEDVKKAKDALDKAKATLNKEDLQKAMDLINALPESDDKKALLEEVKLIDEQIKSKGADDALIENARNLVEIAERTEKSKDFRNAQSAILNLPDCEAKQELMKRSKELLERNGIKFDKLLENLKTNIADDKDLKEEDITELADRYQYLPSDYIEKIKDDYNRVITVYNNQVQDEYQGSLNKEDFKKHSFFDKFREFMGSIVTFVAGTKIASKVNKGRLKLLNKWKDKTKSEKRKVWYEKRIEKVNKSISDNDVVSGVRLFVARNKLAKKKLKLYKGDVKENDFVVNEDNKKIYENRATNRISKSLTKGLNRRLKDEEIFKDKKRVITILDQYLELVASGTYDEEYINQAYDYLEKVKNILSDSEYNGYLEELNIILDYRLSNNGIPYHINTEGAHEVDDVIRFYDSEDYKNATKESRYIKRK